MPVSFVMSVNSIMPGQFRHARLERASIRAGWVGIKIYCFFGFCFLYSLLVIFFIPLFFLFFLLFAFLGRKITDFSFGVFWVLGLWAGLFAGLFYSGFSFAGAFYKGGAFERSSVLELDTEEAWEPDEIALPKISRKKTAQQIHRIFLRLEKRYGNKEANLWFLRYKKALLLQKKDTKAFCQIMTQLSATPDFPLKTLALVKSYKPCAFPSEPLFDPNQVPQWLKLELAQAFYQRRKLFEHEENTLNATLYLAKNSNYKELRLSYLKHAISLVKEKGVHSNHRLSNLRQQLYQESPSRNPKIKVKDFFLVANDFKSRRHFKKAKLYYIKVLNSPHFTFKEKNLSFKALGHIYKMQKDRKRMLKNSKQRSQWLLNQGTKASLTAYAESQLELARKQWNANKNLVAIQSLNRLLQTKSAEFIREKALFLRGSIYYQENQKNKSLKDWDEAIKLLQKQKRQKKLLAKLLWKKALLFREQKKYKEAYKSLAALKKISEKAPHNYNKALFWMAKTKEDLGRNFSAKRHYKELIEKDHFGYYGLLARKNLNKKWEIDKISLNSLKIFNDDQQKSIIHWLNLVGESHLLSLFFKEIEPIFLNSKQISSQDWLKMIGFWTQSGKYLEVFKALSQMDDKTQKEFATKYLALFFPLDFYPEVEKTSQKLKIPKALIFAVIRQESAFDTRARSTADAFGLMQLIPRTARQMAREQKQSFKSFRELYKSSKNILLGTAYLKKLLKQNDQLYLSIATYNAGPIAVKKWQKEFPDLSPLEFVENIGYEETRNYIRLVTRNYIIYHNLLGESENWFPEILTQDEFF